ncbi:protein-tyrosine phosphatase-like protein [Peziza echinospora]|nr:protein-tyrosine phosphatase-like protein [Peziza echinospora]
MPASTRETIYGNVIEYIQDRLYLGCYTAPPTGSTPFPPPTIPNPYYDPPSASRGTPSSKRGRRSNELAITPGQRPVYFSVDDHLLYNAFFHDFGPLHIGHLYRFAVTLHDILGDKANEGRSVVFWSKADARSRSNAAALLACYMVLIQSWPPHLALAPIAQVEPPLMPFRDAGYSQADFSLAVQDVVYGVWKAKEKGVLNIKEFCLEEYERFERVDMGDFNWVTPNFLAFASPQHKARAGEPAVPTTLGAVAVHGTLSQPFKNVLHHFQTRDIGLVVRLNEDLYPAAYFTALGITHLDMYFDDGTCPPLSLVRRFVNLAHCAITVHGKNIAVHCKAGLGRTGCLIGAYLVYRYGFTANEVIAYMRFMRPGMVVGPQQHWLHLNQGEFRQWWFEDMCTPVIRAAQAGGVPSTPTKSKTARIGVTAGTPPHPARKVLGEVDGNHGESGGSGGGGSGQGALLPAPTPGQPRKTSKKFGLGSAAAQAAQAARVPSAASVPAPVYEDDVLIEDQNVDPGIANGGGGGGAGCGAAANSANGAGGNPIIVEKKHSTRRVRKQPSSMSISSNASTSSEKTATQATVATTQNTVSTRPPATAAGKTTAVYASDEAMMSEEEYLLRQTLAAAQQSHHHQSRRRRTSGSSRPTTRAKTGVATGATVPVTTSSSSTSAGNTNNNNVGTTGRGGVVVASANSGGVDGVSYTLTTTTTTINATGVGVGAAAVNGVVAAAVAVAAAAGLTPPKGGSGGGGSAGSGLAGIGMKVRSSPRRREATKEEGGGGVRKVSGRIAGLGLAGHHK